VRGLREIDEEQAEALRRKRLSRPNPPEEWQIVEAPNLRIIDNDLWDAVQTRKKAYGGVHKRMARRPEHMVSGLVRCGCYDASFTVKSKDQLGCAAHRDKGTCNNNRTVRVADLEHRIIEGIKRQFQCTEAITGGERSDRSRQSPA